MHSLVTSTGSNSDWLKYRDGREKDGDSQILSPCIYGKKVLLDIYQIH